MTMPQTATQETIPKLEVFCQTYRDSDGEFYVLYTDRDDALVHFYEIKDTNGGTIILEKAYPVWANPTLFKQIHKNQGRLEGNTPNAPKCRESC